MPLFRRSGDTTLDHLRRALETAQFGQFQFTWWPNCTCGHLYRASTGHRLSMWGVPWFHKEAYDAILRAVIKANGIIGTGDSSRAVSNATIALANRKNVTLRRAAITLIATTIEHLEAKQAQSESSHEFPLAR